MDTLLADVRYALRLIRRSPSFAAVTILTLGLGIGANSAIFSIVHAALIRPLPFADPDRVVMVWEDASFASFPRNTPAPANYFDWRRMNRVFTDMAATRGSVGSLTSGGPPEQVLGRGVTANFFDVLGVRPQLGRVFTDEEDRTGAPVVIISYGLWQRRFAGDAAIVGRVIPMGGVSVTTPGVSRTIVGVMPRAFVFRNRDADFWYPIHFTPEEAAARNSHYLNVVARLKPGVSIQSAREDMARVARELAAVYPDSNRRVGAVVLPIREDLLGNTRMELLVLMAAAGCVLLIACANLAGLLLARAVGRRGEIAVRSALGASELRLVRQMVVEGIVLATAGGVVALVLAPMASGVIATLVPTTMPPAESGAVDLRLLSFTALLAVITGVAFSAVPAIQVSSASLVDGLYQASRSALGRRRLGSGMVIVQVAVTIVLLVCAGLLLRTLANLRGLDLGFRPDHVLTMRTILPADKYQDPAARLAFYTRVEEQVRALPGVVSAAYASNLPFESIGNTNGYRIDSGQTNPDDARDALFRVVTGDYLRAIGVQTIAGRLITGQDAADAPKVLVVNETLAHRHWPDGQAIGHRIAFPGRTSDGPWYTIVGVVKDVRERGYEREMKPGVYLPFAQAMDTWARPQTLVVRTTGQPTALAPAIRRIIASVDPEQPVSFVRTLDDIVDLDVADRTQQLTLIGAFSGLAVLLAAVGLYGLLAYRVAERRRELGLRVALGATVSRIVSGVVGQGLALTAAGVITGLLLAFASARTMRALLYGVAPADPRTLAGAAILFGGIALIASAVPALRAARVDAMSTLREL